MAVAGKVNTTPLEEKVADGESFIYATKQVKGCYFCNPVYVVDLSCEH